MNKNHPNERHELIEQALQESVSGGLRDACSIKCSIFSINVCNIDICSLPEICMTRSR